MFLSCNSLVPIWPILYRRFANVIIRVSIKFSREFDAYLPSPQLRARISTKNSLENFTTILNFKTCEGVFVDVRGAYKDVKSTRFYWIFSKIM
jgi:hypothetical protein